VFRATARTTVALGLPNSHSARLDNPGTSNQAIAAGIDLSHSGQTSMVLAALEEPGCRQNAPGSQSAPPYGPLGLTASRPYTRSIATGLNLSWSQRSTARQSQGLDLSAASPNARYTPSVIFCVTHSRSRFELFERNLVFATSLRIGSNSQSRLRKKGVWVLD
jgi:hypothetical protein